VEVLEVEVGQASPGHIDRRFTDTWSKETDDEVEVLEVEVGQPTLATSIANPMTHCRGDRP
jgi:hypothetical protein